MDITTAIAGVLGLAAGALLLWAVIRLANRGWRKSKGARAVVVVMLAFPALIGPSCWLCSCTGRGSENVSALYSPLIRASRNLRIRPLRDALLWYSELGAADGWEWKFSIRVLQYPDAADGTKRQAVKLIIDWGGNSELFGLPDPSLRSVPVQVR